MYMPVSGDREYMPLPGNIRYIVCVGALIRPRNGVQYIYIYALLIFGNCEVYIIMPVAFKG